MFHGSIETFFHGCFIAGMSLLSSETYLCLNHDQDFHCIYSTLYVYYMYIIISSLKLTLISLHAVSQTLSGKKGGSCINYGVNLNAFGSEVRENIEMKGYQKFVTIFQRSSDCGWMKGCRK